MDPTNIFTLTGEAVSAAEQAKEKMEDEHSYDQYYAFKKVIQSAKVELEKLAATQMVVIVVDELDRCLPSYAIKVLERLHHLFYGLENISVLLAVDKFQLDTTVKQIFSENTNVTTYLKKFINFALKYSGIRILLLLVKKWLYFVTANFGMGTIGKIKKIASNPEKNFGFLK